MKNFTVEDCKDDLGRRLRDRECVAISKNDGLFCVHQWSDDSVSPDVEYDSMRKAAARVLQLLHVGPVAPQTWPETISIGHIETTGD